MAAAFAALFGSNPHRLRYKSPSRQPTFEQWWRAALQHLDADIAPEESKSVRVKPLRVLSHKLGDISSGEALFAFSYQLTTFTCMKCQKKYDLSASDIVAHMRKMTRRNGTVVSGFQCGSCSQINCLGCGLAILNTAQTRNVKCGGYGLSVSWCCDIGRVFLIWALFCGIEGGQPLGVMPPSLVPKKRSQSSKVLGKIKNKKTKKSLPASAESVDYASADKEMFEKLFGKALAKGVDHLFNKAPTNSGVVAPGNVVGMNTGFNHSPNHLTSKPRKTGALPQGVGYGGGIGHWLPQATQPSKSGIRVATEDDEYTAYYLALASLLSASTRKDRLPPSACHLLAHFLPRSPLLFHAANLLRNTSIEDITNRRPLYDALFRFLETLYEYPSLFAVLIQPQTLFPVQQQLYSLCSLSMSAYTRPIIDSSATQEEKEDRKGEEGRKEGEEATEEGEHDTGESLQALVQRIADLGQYMIQQCGKHVADPSPKDKDPRLDACRRFIDANRLLSEKHQKLQKSAKGLVRTETPASRASMSPLSPATLLRPQSPNAAAQSGPVLAGGQLDDDNTAEAASAGAMKAWHREHCVVAIDDEQLLKTYAFRSEAQAVKSSPKDRMKHIIVNLNLLRTSLPQGIFVRHGEGRPDVMKVLIIGPKNTPYEGGAFEFDLFCPMSFPQTHPQMKFKTTGQGTIRFNPNLYNNGHICLSLLGTWGGQGWDQAHSTLLQVLVSIQGMVFCEEPYYNEPGYENRQNVPGSQVYNCTAQSDTINTAMIAWMSSLRPQQHEPDTEAGPASKSAGNAASSEDTMVKKVTKPIQSPEDARDAKKARLQTAAPGDVEIWGDVLRKHFAANARSLLEPAKRYASEPYFESLRSWLAYHHWI